MRKLSLLLVFLLIFSSVYLPIGVSADENYEEMKSYWGDLPGTAEGNPITPPNVHPRVFFTEEKIAVIRNNIDAEENAIAKDLFLKYVNVGLSETGITDKTDSEGRKVYDATVLAQIEACAFYYAIYKGTDIDAKAQKAGQEAVDSISIIKAMEVTTTSDPQRQHGRKLNVLSEVYDWCYPLLKDNKDLITDVVNTCMDIVKNGLELWDGSDNYNNQNEDYNPYWSLGSQGPVAGHGVEKENLRDLLSFAIAFSDVQPDVWRTFGARFYNRYVPARKELFKSGYYQSGTDYGICREYAVACAYYLITGMGLEEPWSGEDMAKYGYANIYLRRPDGQYLYDGDIYTDTTPSFSYSENEQYNLMHMYAAAASSEDAGYFKNEYFRTGIKMSTAKLTQTFYESSPILNLIINNPEIEAKTYQNLPNSKYFPSPAGVMTARTGWEEGANSPSVVANMKINEYDFNDHMHLDSGHFSIYYKGLLATDGGNYKSVTTDEYKMYTKKSIAHNTMLVYDPSEGNFTQSATTNVNDGGQKLQDPNVTRRTIEKFMETSKNSEVLAQEIDPENTQRPYYTYIKGELENSYSDKVEEFKRSFMFLDLKDETFPAALIVFDKVVSSDAKFKKMWLLHGVNKPTVDETNKVTTFTNIDSSYSYNGQMVNKTLLPKSADFDVVGGRAEDGGDGWGVVRGWQYNDTTGKWDITNSVDYGAKTTASKYESNERNTYRLEVSPTTPNKEDHFLNVILIGDAGEQIDANVPLYEDNANFYGTMVEDRVVFFSRDGAKKNSFSYNISGSGTKRYTICDMEKGTYTVTVGGSSREVSVSEEGGVLSFTGAAGQVSAVKKNDIYTKPQDAEYEVLNDRAFIKKGTRFYNSGEQQTDGIVAEVESFAELFGHTTVTTTENSKVVTKIYDGIELVATVRQGDKKIQTKSGTINSSVTPYLNEEGKLVMNLTELSRLLNSESRYLDYANTFYIYNLSSSYKTKLEDIYASGNIKDGKLTVNVKVYNAFETDIYCGIVKGDELITAQKLEEVSVGGADANGCYSTSIDVSKLEDYEVKLYAWGDELYPIKDAMIMEDANLTDELNGYKFHTAQESDLYQNENMTVIRNGSKWVFKRSADIDDDSDVYAYTRQADTHQITEGFLHYSTNLRINKLSNENETIETTVFGTSEYTRSLTTFEGAEYKIDVIVDIAAKKAYIYYNGYKGSKSSWTGFDSVAHYIVNNSGTFGETEFELFDTSMRYYPTTASFSDIEATINKFLILK